MATYTIHLPPAGGPEAIAPERVRFIREAPALMALVFPALWLIWHRLWYWLIVYLLLGAALTLWGGMAVGPVAPAIISAFPAFFLFLEGRELIRRRLERLGWRFAGVVEADSLYEAELRYFSGLDATPQRHARAEPAGSDPAAASVMAGEAPGIGIFGQ